MIHDRLKETYDEFDKYCRSNNVDYSIDADYYNVQAYRLMGRNDVSGTLRHMANYVKDKWVGLEYDGLPVDYVSMKSKDFDVPTYNPLFKFTLTSLQEEEDMPLNEDTIKGPTNAHGRKQSAFPSSFRTLKTRDTYEGGKGGSKKKKKKKNKKSKEAESESLDRSLSFGDRLLHAINETIGVSMVDPEILLVRNTAEHPEEETEEEALNGALQAESLALCKYLAILENTDNEETGAIVEGMIDRCTKQINRLNELLEDGKAGHCAGKCSKCKKGTCATGKHNGCPHLKKSQQ